MPASTDAGPLRPLRVAVARYAVTYWLLVVLLAVYGLQLALLDAGWSGERLRWAFTVQSLAEPTPGWVLGPFSHAFPPALGHLGANLLMLAIFGGLAERHLGRAEYLALFSLTGLATLLVHVWTTTGAAPVNGASGAVYALVIYGGWHVAAEHDRRLTAWVGGDGGLRTVLSFTRFALVVVVPVAAVVQTTAQLLGVVSVGRTAVTGHAAGMVLGALYVYLQPVLVGVPCRNRGGE